MTNLNANRKRQRFNRKFKLETVRLLELGRSPAAQCELCGGAIMNVARYASLPALESGGSLATLDTPQRDIRREHVKQRKGA